MLASALVVFALSVLSAVACAGIARMRGGNPVFWRAMGFAFGPLALPFAWLARRRR